MKLGYANGIMMKQKIESDLKIRKTISKLGYANGIMINILGLRIHEQVRNRLQFRTANQKLGYNLNS